MQRPLTTPDQANSVHVERPRHNLDLLYLRMALHNTLSDVVLKFLVLHLITWLGMGSFDPSTRYALPAFVVWERVGDECKREALYSTRVIISWCKYRSDHDDGQCNEYQTPSRHSRRGLNWCSRQNYRNRLVGHNLTNFVQTTTPRHVSPGYSRHTIIRPVPYGLQSPQTQYLVTPSWPHRQMGCPSAPCIISE